MKTKRTLQEEKTDARAEVSSGSVYESLGLENHIEMETKASLVMEISRVIKKRKLTQTQTATLFNISQPKLSELLSGRFRGYSVGRLMQFLEKLGQDIDIVIRSKPRNRRARISVYHLNEEIRSTVPVTTKNR